MASLTFRAWFTARSSATRPGRSSFRIPRPMWMDYLRWYRQVLDLPVENGVEVTRIAPAADGLLDLDARRRPSAILARKVVMATGRDGLGAAVHPRLRRRPAAAAGRIPPTTIDFAALAAAASW